VKSGIIKAAGLAALSVVGSEAPAAPRMSIFEYIEQTWTVLTRSHQNLAEQAADPKFPLPPGGRWIVYVGRNEELAAVRTKLQTEMTPAEFGKIDIRSLPEDTSQLREQGLLYLPHPYVVPGGRFNEMYGWDSFFIQMGLLRDGKVELAKDLADNFVYEIREYGKILNANRTYYLTRSQPPFLTQMLLAVYGKTQDRKWLADSVPAIETYYRYWTSEPHLTPATGLSRYFDTGEGPAPEVVAAEVDRKGRNEYHLLEGYFKTHHVTDYDVSQYYDAATRQLTPLFYTGDRSMRESGFDPSSRFGPFSIDIIHYDPVCLNSLLYLMEAQTAEIMGLLNRDAEKTEWQRRAGERAQRINRLLWDEKDGLYYDYNFAEARQRRYPFLATFYPLWAGIASRAQAARVAHNLSRFEQPGGLQTSTFHSGDQWDAPFGWAPLQWIAVEGLRRYGFTAEADRISEKFLELMAQEFRKRGTLLEKYDVVRRGADVSSRIHYGYRSNEAGFGWSNAVFTALYDELPPGRQRELLAKAQSAQRF
jgi:alpha,alpha-trehalase